MTFGEQRALRDVLVLALLLVGFTALAVAFWIFTLNWAGLLLPVGFLIGAYAQLRVEVREIEVLPDRLSVRTFFREYPMPRAHIRRVIRSPEGAMVEVLNGNRYAVTPPGVDGEELARTLEDWLASA